jgi:hypothetical protein
MRATSALFIGASILVSISFAPILLSATRTPAVEVARPMPLRELFAGSPLGTVGIFLLGSVYATQSGMGAVFGTQIGMTADADRAVRRDAVRRRAGAAISDRLAVGPDGPAQADLRGVAALASSSARWGGSPAGGVALMAAAFIAGGVTTPLYALFLAYTNDFLSAEDMPAASGGLVFTFGLGAIAGPLATGWAMQGSARSPSGWCSGATFAAIALYALYRMTQRAAVPVDETESYLGVLPTASPWRWRRRAPGRPKTPGGS